MRAACVAIALLWSAVAGAEDVLYRLPWSDGLSFMFTQVSDGRITTHFTKATLHAVDIAMPEGIAVLAAREGIVEALETRQRSAGDDAQLTYEGNFVRVRHKDGTAATYAHLRDQGIAAQLGEVIAAGQLLGYSGRSGDVVEPHLHFVVTRTEENSAGWREEVSIPVKFYVGVPPIVFAPRAALIVTANYSGPAGAPRLPSEIVAYTPWKRPPLEAGDELLAWMRLALWLVCGVAAMSWFWSFAKR